MKNLFFLFLILSGFTFSQIRYLDLNSPANNGDGLSWETAWNSFSQFNINTDIPENGTLKIAPGVYNVGQSAKYYEENCFIWVRNKKNITIEKSDPFGTGTYAAVYPGGSYTPDPNPVILKGNAIYKYGIVLAPPDSSSSVSSIVIQGITFRNFGLNSIKTRG